MKKLILISGALILILNFLSFLIIGAYGIQPFILSEICIMISCGFIYYVSLSTLDDALKIFLVLSLILLATIKFIISLFFHLPLKNNYSLLSILIIIFIELLAIFGFKYFSRHS